MNKALTKNERFLKDYDPMLLYELEQAKGPEVTVEAAGPGWTAHQDGFYFHDRDSPSEEAHRVVSEDRARVHIHFGFGLGYFVEADAVAPKGVVLVFEPNPSLVRAAMQRRDLEEVFKGKTVRVCCSMSRFRFLAARYCAPKQRAVLFVSQYHAQIYQPILGLFEKVVGALGPVRMVEYVERMFPHILRETVRSWRHTARLPDAALWKDVLKDKPGVIVAAGPSLDSTLEGLRQIRDEVIIFAIARSAGPLEQVGIEPDFLVHAEPQDFYHLIKDRSNLKDTRFLLADQSQEQFFTHAHGSTYVFQSDANTFSNYLIEHYPDQDKLKARSGGSVATAAFFLAMYAGCDPLILVGQDLALKGERIYATDELNLPFEYQQEHLIEVEAYGGGKTQTLPHYHANLKWYGSSAALLAEERPELKLVNATGGGARIKGFEELTLAEAQRYLKGPITMCEPTEVKTGLTRQQVRAFYRVFEKDMRALRTLLEERRPVIDRFIQGLARMAMPNPGTDLPYQEVKIYLDFFKRNTALLHIFGAEVVGMRLLGEPLSQCEKPDDVVDAWARVDVIHEDTLFTCGLLLKVY